MDAAMLVGGREVGAPVRASRYGVVFETTGGSAIRLDDPRADSDLIAACEALTAARLPGVWPVVDLVRHDGEPWLFTAAPPGPTLAEIDLAAISPLALAGALNEVGQTLSALRRLGWSHEGLSSESVIPGPDGIARLADAPCAIIRGSADAAAWAALVEETALRRGVAGLFGGAADAARAHGLDAGLAALAAFAATQPADADRRASLRAAVDGWQPPAPAQATPAAPPPSSSTIQSARHVRPQPAAAAAGGTMPGVRRRTGATPVPAVPAGPGATVLGSRHAPDGRRGAPIAPPVDGLIRFGPGVPAVMPAAVGVEARPAAPRPRRRKAWWLSSAVTLAILGVLIWWWLRPSDPLRIASVTAAGPGTTVGCNHDAKLVATVRTNGAPGTLTYRWHRSDGSDSGLMHEDVADGQTAAQLELRWRVEGHGTFHGLATVLVIAPTPRIARTTFDYRCP